MRCEAVFLNVKDHPFGPLWISNFIPSRPSLADGTVRHVVEMTLDDLKQWEVRNVEVETYLHDSTRHRFNS